MLLYKFKKLELQTGLVNLKTILVLVSDLLLLEYSE